MAETLMTPATTISFTPNGIDGMPQFIQPLELEAETSDTPQVFSQDLPEAATESLAVTLAVDTEASAAVDAVPEAIIAPTAVRQAETARQTSRRTRIARRATAAVFSSLAFLAGGGVAVAAVGTSRAKSARAPSALRAAPATPTETTTTTTTTETEPTTTPSTTAAQAAPIKPLTPTQLANYENRSYFSVAPSDYSSITLGEMVVRAHYFLRTGECPSPSKLKPTTPV